MLRVCSDSHSEANLTRIGHAVYVQRQPEVESMMNKDKIFGRTHSLENTDIRTMYHSLRTVQSLITSTFGIWPMDPYLGGNSKISTACTIHEQK